MALCDCDCPLTFEIRVDHRERGLDLVPSEVAVMQEDVL